MDVDGVKRNTTTCEACDILTHKGPYTSCFENAIHEVEFRDDSSISRAFIRIG